MKPWPEIESTVRSYCREFPTEFAAARGSVLLDVEGNRYIDFLSCAGALNYGHNNPAIKKAVSDYLAEDGVVAGLDLYTKAKRTFIELFSRHVLQPRGLPYKIQFTNPTGASCIESAVKLARKLTGRSNVIAFTNAYHGMSASALSLTGGRKYRQSHMMGGVTRLPFEGYMGREFDSVQLLRRLLEDPSSGIDRPAAIVVETIQGEGGVNVASAGWLQRLGGLAVEHDILFVVDDVQVGCGRTGRFFSFEQAGIVPDIVCMAKAISGLGLPMALLLFRSEHDVWEKGEDIGTFRGNNLAFVGGAKAISEYWADDGLQSKIASLEKRLRASLMGILDRHHELLAECRGRGLIYGLEFRDPAMAEWTSRRCFERGLIVETCGPRGQVLKLLPALTIDESVLEEGLDLLGGVLDAIATGVAPPRVAAL